MSAITVRNLPPAVAKAVKERARREKLSLNKAIVKLLEEATIGAEPRKRTLHHELDHLAGTWSEEEYEELMQALREQRQIDRDVDMSRYQLDTSAYAAFFRSHPEAKALVQEASELFLSPIVLGELRSGFLKGGRLPQNERQLQEFLASPRCRVPVIDDDTAHRYAAIHDYLRRQGTPVSPNDLWIAASAAQHGLTVATLNGHFEQIPHVLVRKFEPLSAPQGE